MAAMDDFYEDDEPVEEVIRAFNEGEKGVTGPATWSSSAFLNLPGRIGKLLDRLHNQSTKELPAR